MGEIHMEASKVIDAPAERIYAVLADYRTSHPAILPKAYFKGLRVEAGGVGAGTVVVADMEVYGVRRSYRLTVSEPQPGRVLAEADAAAGMATQFILEPVGDGRQTRLTIASDVRTSGGVQGWLERMMNPAIMRKIYNEELELIAGYVVRQADAVA